MKKRKRRIRPGVYVRIAKDCREGEPATGAVGVYEGLFNSKTGQRYKGSRAGEQGMPRIRLEDGSQIWGFECFWLPLKEALSAEREAGVPSILPKDDRDFLETLSEITMEFPPGALDAMEQAEEEAAKRLAAAYDSDG
jgi:hypothetical protein